MQLGPAAEEAIAELPIVIHIGCRTDTSGRTYCWKGVKFHTDLAEGRFVIPRHQFPPANDRCNELEPQSVPDIVHQNGNLP
jgi:hypothetical protein